MSERYTRLFSLSENLYTTGSPVIISAGALLKDNQTGGIVAQLKLKSIVQKTIKTVKVSIASFDSLNRPVEGIVEHTYLDINAVREQEFGQKEPIILSNSITRAFSVNVVEVGFVDNEVWMGGNTSWNPLQTQDTLESLCKDEEMEKQFRIEFGDTARFIPRAELDLWRCFCGTINHKGESVCYKCGCAPSFDFNVMVERRNQRVMEEYEKAQQREKDLAVKKKKSRKLAAIILSTVMTIIGVALLLTFVIFPNSRYKNANNLLRNGKYDEAAEAFRALGDYKDSKDKAIEAENEKKYSEAMDSLAGGDFKNAESVFLDLNDYKDSKKKAKEAKYKWAEERLENGYYDIAEKAFTELKSYDDSETRVKEVKYRKAVTLLAADETEKAFALLCTIEDYEDTKEKQEEIYNQAADLLDEGIRNNKKEMLKKAFDIFSILEKYNYSDSGIKASQCKKERMREFDKYTGRWQTGWITKTNGQGKNSYNAFLTISLYVDEQTFDVKARATTWEHVKSWWNGGLLQDIEKNAYREYECVWDESRKAFVVIENGKKINSYYKVYSDYIENESGFYRYFKETR